ncbi:MAG: RNA methyltransferase [Bacteroidales bacterium]
MPQIGKPHPILSKLSFEDKKRLYEYLAPMCPENKLELFEKNVNLRTRHITVVLEDVEHPHNGSAVLRSCDCFGIQEMHFIEKEYRFKVSVGPAAGSDKWVNYKKYSKSYENPTRACLEDLKAKGYRIIATTPHEKDCMVADLDVSEKTAFVFGTERTGISDDVREMADGFVKLPMYGFAESYNISVCAALVLYDATERMRKNPEIEWQLSEEEKMDVCFEWQRLVLKRYELLLPYAVEQLGLEI